MILTLPSMDLILSASNLETAYGPIALIDRSPLIAIGVEPLNFNEASLCVPFDDILTLPSIELGNVAAPVGVNKKSALD